MDSDLAGKRRVTEGPRVVNPTTGRFDQSNTNPPSLARVDRDVRLDKPTTVASPYPTITRDTQIADVIVDCGGKWAERGAESWTHSHSVAW
jgi:hypothetical protein